VSVVRLTGMPSTELCMRGVDKLYRGKRVATSRTITNVQLMQSLSRFKCSIHRLEVECGRHAKLESVLRRDRVCRMCSLGAVEDEDHLLLVCPAHHDIRCKFGQHLGKQLTPCSLLRELMHSATQKAIALYLVSCLDNKSVLLKSTR
jgi:hypothetical protein